MDYRIEKENENNSIMIRRWIPKGEGVSINNYPRAMFDYKSSNMILLKQYKALLFE